MSCKNIILWEGINNGSMLSKCLVGPYRLFYLFTSAFPSLFWKRDIKANYIHIVLVDNMAPVGLPLASSCQRYLYLQQSIVLLKFTSLWQQPLILYSLPQLTIIRLDIWANLCSLGSFLMHTGYAHLSTSPRVHTHTHTRSYTYQPINYVHRGP